MWGEQLAGGYRALPVRGPVAGSRRRSVSRSTPCAHLKAGVLHCLFGLCLVFIVSLAGASLSTVGPSREAFWHQLIPNDVPPQEDRCLFGIDRLQNPRPSRQRRGRALLARPPFS